MTPEVVGELDGIDLGDERLQPGGIARCLAPVVCAQVEQHGVEPRGEAAGGVEALAVADHPQKRILHCLLSQGPVAQPVLGQVGVDPAGTLP